MAEPAAVRYERTGALAEIIIDHPPVNVLSREVLVGLSDAIRKAESDTGARAVVLRGESPKAFAAGADIREMASLDSAGAYRHGSRGQGVTVQIERLPLPVIAAIHGSCLGGGCEIALACDFVVASEDAVFGQPEIRLGVMPGWGGTRRLPRRIGAVRARDWILTGRSVAAAEAREAGLVWKVVPRASLREEAMALGNELARHSAIALAAAKYALNRAIDPLEGDGLAYELALWSRLFGTDGQREGMRAFLEKRPPTPVGRERWFEESAPFPFHPASPETSDTASPSAEPRRAKEKT